MAAAACSSIFRDLKGRVYGSALLGVSDKKMGKEMGIREKIGDRSEHLSPKFLDAAPPMGFDLHSWRSTG